MAVINVPYSASVGLRLTGPVNPSSGNNTTINLTLAAITPSADNEKIMAVVDLAAAVLLYPVFQVRKTIISTLEKQS